MRKILMVLFIFAFSLASTGMLIAQNNKEDAKFQKALEDYLDTLWKFYPTQATMAGFHEYDDKLENFSNRNVSKQYEKLDELNESLVVEIDKTQLSPEVQIEYEMIVDGLSLELLQHESLIPWEYDPLFYNKILFNCVRPLMTGDFSNPEDRAKNAVKRLNEIPKFLNDVMKNLKTPPQISTETAIQQFPAVMNFYQNEMPQLIQQAAASQREDLQKKLADVIPALNEYQAYLNNDLLPKSTGNFRLLTAHVKMARMSFQNLTPLQQIAEIATADINNIRREMALICISFYKIMDPKFNVESPPSNLSEEQVRDIIISHVLDKLKVFHPTKDDFMQALKASQQEVKEFIQEKELLNNLPDTELNMEEMPEIYRTGNRFRLKRPAVYDDSRQFTLQIAPLDEDLSDEDIQAILEEHNDFILPFFTARNIYPGSFVPAYLSLENASMTQKLYPNRALLQGWPIFAEEMMALNGIGNYDLRYRLHQLKMKLKAAIDFILDLQIHQGSMTQEQAVNYMTRVGFQSKAEAEKNWNRIVLMPLEAAYPYVGYRAMLDMEENYKQIKGDSYNQKEFLEKLLSYGPIPLRVLREKIK
ncbi:MAG: DUF885 family protein [Candidatus Aminicenantes bacterium]|nr:DUF885 family protein [Candidatus Aminicenantes bacterium]